MAFIQSVLPAEVSLVRVPEGGIQPQAVVDARDVVHMVYYKGDPRAGDLFYVRQAPNATEFSRPVQVNSIKGSAIAMGTIRGAQLAIGRKGQVHVVWNGGDGAPTTPKHRGAPFLYTRLTEDRTRFEPERDMLTAAGGLDGGGSVAADQAGNVYVVWHALKPEADAGEDQRAVYVARSENDGQTFAQEQPLLEHDFGVCACCGLRAFADPAGALYVLYRAASAMTNRDEVLLISRDRARHFTVANADRWVTGTCPMSSAFFSAGGPAVLAAWETDSQVFWATVDAKTGVVSARRSVPGEPGRRHPVAVANATDQTLFVWTEGTGWEKGGSVAWQLFDHAGKALPIRGRREGVPVWSMAAGIAKADGNFVIIY